MQNFGYSLITDDHLKNIYWNNIHFRLLVLLVWTKNKLKFSYAVHLELEKTFWFIYQLI